MSDDSKKGPNLGLIVAAVVAGTGLFASITGHMWPDNWWNAQVPLGVWKWSACTVVILLFAFAVTMASIQSNGEILNELHDAFVPAPKPPPDGERAPVVVNFPRSKRDPHPPTAPLPRAPEEDAS